MTDPYKELREERDELRDVLLRNGFVECDISICNCGSWHARYGYPERMQNIKELLSDAGHPLSNDNGNLVINALRQLVSERDALKEALEESQSLFAAMLHEQRPRSEIEEQMLDNRAALTKSALADI